MPSPGHPPLPPIRCYWTCEEDGTTTLIPGCWSRVHNPHADCLCTLWSEDTARRTIRSMEAAIYRERNNVQVLRAALRRAGLPDHPEMADTRQLSARQRRRAMHKAITDAGKTDEGEAE